MSYFRSPLGAISRDADTVPSAPIDTTKLPTPTSSRSTTTVTATVGGSGRTRDTQGAVTRDHRGGAVTTTGPTSSPVAPAPVAARKIPPWLLWGGVIAAGLGVAYYAVSRR